MIGSPWDEDKAMMSRWGLEGMQSFEQTSVAKKEGSRLQASGLEPVSGSWISEYSQNQEFCTAEISQFQNLIISVVRCDI